MLLAEYTHPDLRSFYRDVASCGVTMDAIDTQCIIMELLTTVNLIIEKGKKDNNSDGYKHISEFRLLSNDTN
ncbi:Cell division control protein [Dirofilaria immitis]